MLSKLSSSLIVASAAAGIVLWWYYRVRNLNRIPEKWQLVGYVDSIAIYPVKSCGYKTLNRAECTERGLKEIPSEDEAKKHLFRDREFLIYDVEKEHVLSIHKCQKALLITVHSTEEDTVVFQAPGESDYKLKLSSILQNPKCIKIRSYTSVHETVDCGDDVAEWFSNYLVGRSEGFRLGYFVDNVSKTQNVIKALADQSYELLSIYKHIREDDAGIYSSLSSYLVTNRSSLDELNNRLAEEDQCNIFNFRPNIVVRDCKPFEEDNWEWIKIGNEIVMRYFKPCTRCTITTIDANTSKRNKNLQPFKMLKSYRKLKQIKGYDCQGDSPVFGINVGLYAPGKIKVGDPVYASF